MLSPIIGTLWKRDYDGRYEPPDDHVDEKVENEFYVSSDFHMMNVLTKKVRSADFENQMRNFIDLHIVLTVKDIVGVVLVIKFLHNFLSGTPLHEALLALNQILPQFKKIYGS